MTPGELLALIAASNTTPIPPALMPPSGGTGGTTVVATTTPTHNIYGSPYGGTTVVFEPYGGTVPGLSTRPETTIPEWDHPLPEAGGYIQDLIRSNPAAFWNRHHSTTAFEKVAGFVAGFAGAYLVGGIGAAVWGWQAAAGISLLARIGTSIAIGGAAAAVAFNVQHQGAPWSNAFMAGAKWGTVTYGVHQTVRWAGGLFPAAGTHELDAQYNQWGTLPGDEFWKW